MGIARTGIARTGIAYGAVAVTCLGLHNAVMIAVDRGFRAHVSGLAVLVIGFALSFVLVSVVGYLLHSRFTFRQPVSARRYARYALAMSTNTPLAFAVTWLLKGPVALPMVWAAPIASGGMVVANFLLSRWAIKHSGKARA